MGGVLAEIYHVSVYAEKTANLTQIRFVVYSRKILGEYGRNEVITISDLFNAKRNEVPAEGMIYSMKASYFFVFFSGYF